MDIVRLRSLGLGKYEAVFRDNEITEKVLPNLTAEDLKELGVAALGHRRTLLDAIAAHAFQYSVISPQALSASSPSRNSCRSDDSEQNDNPHCRQYSGP